MKILVMGTGGIGGYFGGRLAEKGEHDLFFVARGPHLAAIKENGLKIISPFGDAHISDVAAGEDPATFGPVDVILFAVKLYDVPAALEQCRPCIGSDTAVISLQNGIGTEALIEQAYGPKHAVGGIAYAPVAIESPGVVQHMGGFASLVFGELSGDVSSRLQDLANACQDAGFEAKVSDNIERDLWDKFVFLSSFAGVTCLTRQPCRILQEDREAHRFFVAAVSEAVKIARAKGIALADDCEDRLAKLVLGMAPDGQSSMLTDLQSGKPLENAWFSGRLVALGRELGIPTPMHEAFNVALRPYENPTDPKS